MESMRLDYPTATFETLSVSGELQASRLPCFPWLKNFSQFFTTEATETRSDSCDFRYAKAPHYVRRST